jgi:predicted ABC-type transport system involved in lysophospholipase L1 biosynthesis ATPase subunit
MMNADATFSLTMRASDAAFADEETGEVDAYSASREIARILHSLADRVGSGELLVNEPHTVLDENGNAVGTFVLDV